MTSTDCGLRFLYNLMLFHVLLIIMYCTPLTSMADTVKLSKSKQYKIEKKKTKNSKLCFRFLLLLSCNVKTDKWFPLSNTTKRNDSWEEP